MLHPADLLPPRSRWAVGVSGGADSVALLRLLHDRGDLALHVVHLDHQARGADSAADAAFVSQLAVQLGLPCTVATRAEVERFVAPPPPPANRSARFRALRLALFRDVVTRHALDGVAVAHHADDVAETVLHRLLRGSGVSGLAGIDARTAVGGVNVARPLLGCRRDALRVHLRAIGQPWREDASNASSRYARNRHRRVLADTPALTDALLRLAAACRGVRAWTRAAAPVLASSAEARSLAVLPDVLARESARRWLVARGAPPADLGSDVLARLLDMARDAAAPGRQSFPGGLSVRRRRGTLSADAGPSRSKPPPNPPGEPGV